MRCDGSRAPEAVPDNLVANVIPPCHHDVDVARLADRKDFVDRKIVIMPDGSQGQEVRLESIVDEIGRRILHVLFGDGVNLEESVRQCLEPASVAPGLVQFQDFPCNRLLRPSLRL